MTDDPKAPNLSTLRLPMLVPNVIPKPAVAALPQLKVPDTDLSADAPRSGRIAGFIKVAELSHVRYIELQNKLYFVSGATHCTAVLTRAVLNGLEFLKKHVEDGTTSMEEAKVRAEVIHICANLITQIGVQYSDEQQQLVGEGRLLAAQVDDMSQLCHVVAREYLTAQALSASIEDARQYCPAGQDDVVEVPKKRKKRKVQAQGNGVGADMKVRRKKKKLSVS